MAKPVLFKKFRDEILTDEPSRNVTKKNAWGFHLIIDMSGCDERMASEKYVKVFFDELIKELDMVPLTKIMTARVDQKGNRGVSAVQMITTSSITFHGDDENMCIYLDIFSCKTYDRIKVVNTIVKYFKPKHMASQFLYRDAGPSEAKES